MQGPIESLVDELWAIHGYRRITVNRPAIEDVWATALARAGFRPDSALSVHWTPREILFDAGPTRIRPATGNDAPSTAALFEQSLLALSRTSPFVEYDSAAMREVHARIAGCDAGRTDQDSHVWVAETLTAVLSALSSTGAVSLPRTMRFSVPRWASGMY